MLQVLVMMIIGKTVRVRHKPVLAVIEGCSGWGAKDCCGPYPIIMEFATGDTREGGCVAG